MRVVMLFLLTSVLHFLLDLWLFLMLPLHWVSHVLRRGSDWAEVELLLCQMRKKVEFTKRGL